MDAGWDRTHAGDAHRVALCVVAVVVAHAAAMAVADGRRAARPLVAPSPAETTLRIVSARPLADPVPSAPIKVPPPLDSPPESRASAAPRLLTSAGSAVAQSPVAAGARFWGFDEVDTPADPEAAWNLSLDTLDAASLDGVAFDVWIDARGRIVACSLLETIAIAPASRAALEAELMATAMTPAVRHGARVASHRRVEIYVDGLQTSPPGR